MSFSVDSLQFVYPFAPAAIRGLCLIPFRRLLPVTLGEPVLAREEHRNYIIALAGFTFAGLVALVVLDAANIGAMMFPIYDLFVSFVCFTSALSLQHYKATRWQDQLGTALADVGAFAQYVAVLNLLQLSHLPPLLLALLFAASLAAWLADFRARLLIELRYFQHLMEAQDVR